MSETIKQLIVALFAAHVIGDFILQSDEDVKTKYRTYILIKHSLILSVLSYLAVGLWNNWIIPLVIFVTHLIIDTIKIRLCKIGLGAFVVDQLAHLGVIACTVYILFQLSMVATSTYWIRELGTCYYIFLVILSGAIVAIYAGGVVVGLAVKPLQDQLATSLNESKQSSGKSSQTGSRGFEEGGKVIGQLERALIFLLVLVDQPAAIGFLIAAKSIFRFGEIKEKSNRLEAEYIIIGTLMSFLFGLAAAYLTRKGVVLFP